MDPDERTHALHVFDNETGLLESILGFYREALPQGGTAIAIARRATAMALQEHFDNSARVPEVRLVVFDADETLNRVMYAAMPDQARFDAIVGRALRDNSGNGPVAAFGEMVAVLWDRGEADAAIELERVWNHFGKEHGLTLLCAYSAATLADPATTSKVAAMYNEHSKLDVPRTLVRPTPATR